MLEAHAHIPPDARDGAPVLVLLHGRGSDEHDLQGLAPHLPADAALVTPRAPHPGGPWGYGAGWAWYRYLHDDRVEAGTLARSLAALDGFLDGLPGLLPVRPGPLALGGFSQGGTTSLAYAMTRPGRVRRVIVLSGFLVDDPSVPVDPEAAEDLDVFWGHGTLDPAIPHALGAKGRKRISEAGVRVRARDYPIGHGVSVEELADVRSWLKEGARGEG